MNRTLRYALVVALGLTHLGAVADPVSTLLDADHAYTAHGHQSSERSSVLDESFTDVDMVGQLRDTDEASVPVLSVDKLFGRVFGEIGIVVESVRRPGAVARLTRIWAQHDGEWRLLHTQATPMAPYVTQKPWRHPVEALPIDEPGDQGEVVDQDTLLREVEGVEQQRSDALRSADESAVERLTGDDFVSIDVRGVWQTKGALYVVRGPYDDFRSTIQDIRAFGSVVIVKGVEQLRLRSRSFHAERPAPTRDDPRALRVSARFVRVWVRRDRTWQCVGEHLTAPSLPPQF